MKNKTTGFVVVALLAMIALFYLSSSQKKIGTVDFTAKYKQTPPIELAGFEQGEGWVGNFTYDNGQVLEGNTSAVFTSWYGKENTISQQKQFDVKGYRNGYLLLFVKSKEQLSALTSLSLTFQNNKNEKKVFPLSHLTAGWNRLAFSLPDWEKITSTELSITSSPNLIAEINLDRLWLQKNDDYKNDINTSSNTSSLRTIGDRVYYFSASDKAVSYTFPQLQSFGKGTMTVAFIPEHAKKATFSLNNASLSLSLDSSRTCILANNKKESVKKTLTKNVFENNTYVFVKATTSKDKLKFALSNNGVDFEDCGEIKMDGKSGPQLLLEGSYLVDSYSFEY